MNQILVIPSLEKGRGGGHFFRSLTLVKALHAGGEDAWLFVNNNLKSFYNSHSELKCTSFNRTLDEEAINDRKWDLIVLDHFRTEKNELKRWTKLAPVLGIDEGLSREDCDFLIDVLPGLPWKEAGKKANLCDPSLLPLPKNRRSSFFPSTNSHVIGRALRILVSFGAEDPALLTVNTALTLQNILGKDASLSVVLGPLRKNNDLDKKTLEQKGIIVIEGKEDSLKEDLANYDLLITHFGITAFEALYARLPVLLINPGPYHEELSRHAGLVYLKGVKFPGSQDFTKLYSMCIEKSEKAALRWGLEKNSTEESSDLGVARLLLDAKPVVYRKCPLCTAPQGRVLGRFPGRTYRLCSCGTILMNRLTPPVAYNRDYFFTEYKKQYGKTYLEDFPKLQKDGERRLSKIIKILNHRGHVEHKEEKKVFHPERLLDIGCAYGPFLAAAKKEGFEVLGIDPAPDAVDYVRETLEIASIQGTFPESLPELYKINGMDKDKEFFDVITLWYVIEHLDDPGKALQAVNGLLKTGGILAFSTPSARGISRRRSLLSFLERSPPDHFTIWDPRRTAALMKRYGFCLKKTIITGHHPERFPFFFPGLWFCTALSKIFGLGDTFEVYAVKVRDLYEEKYGS